MSLRGHPRQTVASYCPGLTWPRPLPLSDYRDISPLPPSPRDSRPLAGLSCAHLSSWTAHALKFKRSGSLCLLRCEEKRKPGCGWRARSCLSSFSLLSGTQAPRAGQGLTEACCIEQTRMRTRQGKPGMRKPLGPRTAVLLGACLPDMEVLDVDVFIRGCLSLAPEEESFLGRGLCKHKTQR